MLQDMFVVGTFWFYTFIIFEFILLIFFTDREWWGGSFISVILVLGAFAIWGDFNFIPWIKANPKLFAACVVGYFVPLGISVGGMKWYFYLIDTRDENRKAKEEWLSRLPDYLDRAKRDLSDNSNPRYNKQLEKLVKNYQEAIDAGNKMTESIWPEWKKYEKEFRWYDGYGQARKIQRPLSKDNKARIASWITWWPVVGFWSLLHDPLRRVGLWLYDRLAHTLERISQHVWRDEEEFPSDN